MQIRPRTSSEWWKNALNQISVSSPAHFIRNTADDKSIRSDLSRYITANSFSKVPENIDRWHGRKRVVYAKPSSSIENDLNTWRIENFHEYFTSELLLALKVDSVEPGVLGVADSIISKCLNINSIVTALWLNELFINNFNRPALASDLLLLVGRLPYKIANPTGVTMAIAGFSHSNAAVQEAAIRAFENWANIDSLKILLNVDVKPAWLRKYLDNVISDLKALHETLG